MAEDMDTIEYAKRKLHLFPVHVSLINAWCVFSNSIALVVHRVKESLYSNLVTVPTLLGMRGRVQHLWRAKHSIQVCVRIFHIISV